MRASGRRRITSSIMFDIILFITGGITFARPTARCYIDERRWCDAARCHIRAHPDHDPGRRRRTARSCRRSFDLREAPRLIRVGQSEAFGFLQVCQRSTGLDGWTRSTRPHQKRSMNCYGAVLAPRIAGLASHLLLRCNVILLLVLVDFTEFIR